MVEVSYDDAEGDDKSAEQTSAHPVRSAPASNIVPGLSRREPSEIKLAVLIIQPREVDENTASGENIGARVAATDSGDVLDLCIRGCCGRCRCRSVVRHRQGDGAANDEVMP